MLLATAAGLLPPASFPRLAFLRSRAFPALCCGALLLLPLAGFHTARVVPGAVDNASGVAVMHALGRELSSARAALASSGDALSPYSPLLRTTEVVLLATSSEEAGLRGAKRYVERHAAELHALPTVVLVLECAADASALAAVASEPWPGARHHPDAVRLLVAAAARAADDESGAERSPASSELRVISLPIGATDAAAFTAVRVPAVALQALSASPAVLPRAYHTRDDVLAAISLGAAEAMLDVARSFAQMYGEGGLTQQAAGAGARGGGSDGEL